MSYLDTLAATLSPLAAVLPILPLLPLLLAAALLTVGAMATDRSESWARVADRYQPDRATVLRRIGPDPIIGRARSAVHRAMEIGRIDLALRARDAFEAGAYQTAISLSGVAVRWAPRFVAVPAPAPAPIPSAPMSRPALFARPVLLLVPVAPVAPVARQAA